MHEKPSVDVILPYLCYPIHVNLLQFSQLHSTDPSLCFFRINMTITPMFCLICASWRVRWTQAFAGPMTRSGCLLALPVWLLLGHGLLCYFTTFYNSGIAFCSGFASCFSKDPCWYARHPNRSYVKNYNYNYNGPRGGEYHQFWNENMVTQTEDFSSRCESLNLRPRYLVDCNLHWTNWPIETSCKAVTGY